MLETLIAKQGTIDADTRAAYELLLTDLQRIELGAQSCSSTTLVGQPTPPSRLLLVSEPT